MKASRLLSEALVFVAVLMSPACGQAPLNTPQPGARLKLPAPETKGGMSVEEALARRASVREFTRQPLAQAELSQLLWAAQGITHGKSGRTAPSAGALYPLELYVAVRDGFYRYEPYGHELQRITADDLRSNISKAALNQPALVEAAAVFVFTAVYERTARRYGEERARRYVLIEIGHAAQNLLLEAVALRLGGVPVGAFNDSQLQKVLPVPGDHTVLYLVAVGYPQ